MSTTTKPIYQLTVGDFNCALSAVLGTADISDEQYERILKLVRKDVDYVSGEVDGWNHYFATAVRDAARFVLSPRLFEEDTP